MDSITSDAAERERDDETGRPALPTSPFSFRDSIQLPPPPVRGFAVRVGGGELGSLDFVEEVEVELPVVALLVGIGSRGAAVPRPGPPVRV